MYGFKNDQKKHIDDLKNSYFDAANGQEFPFFDKFLFEHGLMNFLKEIDGKYDCGELQTLPAAHERHGK